MLFFVINIAQFIKMMIKFWILFDGVIGVIDCLFSKTIY